MKVHLWHLTKIYSATLSFPLWSPVTASELRSNPSLRRALELRYSIKNDFFFKVGKVQNPYLFIVRAIIIFILLSLCTCRAYCQNIFWQAWVNSVKIGYFPIPPFHSFTLSLVSIYHCADLWSQSCELSYNNIVQALKIAVKHQSCDELKVCGDHHFD